MTTAIVVPLAYMGLCSFISRIHRAQFPKLAPMFALVPIVATVTFVLLMAGAVGYGWKTSTPCGGSASIEAETEVYACLMK